MSTHAQMDQTVAAGTVTGTGGSTEATATPALRVLHGDLVRTLCTLIPHRRELVVLACTCCALSRELMQQRLWPRRWRTCAMSWIHHVKDLQRDSPITRLSIVDLGRLQMSRSYATHPPDGLERLQYFTRLESLTLNLRAHVLDVGRWPSQHDQRIALKLSAFVQLRCTGLTSLRVVQFTLGLADAPVGHIVWTHLRRTCTRLVELRLDDVTIDTLESLASDVESLAFFRPLRRLVIGVSNLVDSCAEGSPVYRACLALHRAIVHHPITGVSQLGHVPSSRDLPSVDVRFLFRLAVNLNRFDARTHPPQPPDLLHPAEVHFTTQDVRDLASVVSPLLAWHKSFHHAGFPRASLVLVQAGATCHEFTVDPVAEAAGLYRRIDTVLVHVSIVDEHRSHDCLFAPDYFGPWSIVRMPRLRCVRRYGRSSVGEAANSPDLLRDIQLEARYTDLAPAAQAIVQSQQFLWRQAAQAQADEQAEVPRLDPMPTFRPMRIEIVVDSAAMEAMPLTCETFTLE